MGMRHGRWRRHWDRLAGLFVLLGAACNPGTLAPPLRASVSLAPEALGRGRASTAASFTQARMGTLFGGGVALVPSLRQHIGLTPWMNLDVDASANADKRATVMMGSVGLRLFPVQTRYLKLGLAWGLGLGCGGFYRADDDEGVVNPCLSEEHRRLAGGGYVGVDFGLRLGRHVALYQVNRYQLAFARGVPMTHWLHVAGGIQFDFGPDSLVFISLEGGYGAYWNSKDRRDGAVGSIAIGFRYRLRRRAPPPSQPRPPQAHATAARGK